MLTTHGGTTSSLKCDQAIPSLEKVSYLCVISNLKSYSSKTLSMLPLKVRHKILLNSPVHNLLFVEDPDFTSGIDMRSVWATIFKERVPSTFYNKYKKLSSPKRFRLDRQNYMETIGLCILNKLSNRGANSDKDEAQGIDNMLLLNMIFSVHHCMGIRNWRTFLEENPQWKQHFQSFPPPREHIVVPSEFYHKYYESKDDLSDDQLISLLLDGCCYNPLFQVQTETFLISRLSAIDDSNISQPKGEGKSPVPQQEAQNFAANLIAKGFNFKHYKYCNEYIPNPTGYWLLHRAEHPIQLHTLELQNVVVDPGYSILTQIAMHPSLSVRRIYLSKLDIPHCCATMLAFQSLLAMKDLEVLSVCSCKIGESGVLQDITMALNFLSVCKYTMVTSLKFRGNKFGKESDQNIRNFFGAIFATYSYQALHLDLDIRNNHLVSKHFGILLAEWKNGAKLKKLAQFYCGGNEVSQYQMCSIKDISHWTSF